ncbi:MAG: MFS transporter, partial [Chloroflexota bacterium]
PPFMMEHSGAQERTHLFSWYQAVAAFAGIAGGIMGGNLPGWFAGWLGVVAQDVTAYQAAVVALALISGVSLIPLFVLRANSTGVRRISTHPLRGVRADGPLLFKLLFPNLLIALGAGLFIPFRNVFFRTRFGVSDGDVGIIFALAALVAAVAIVLGPVTAQRFGKVRAVAVQQSLSVPLILVMGFAPFFPLVVAATLVRTALMQMSGPVFNAYTMEVVRDETRVTASSLMNMVWTLGWVVSAPISGQLQLGGDWAGIFIGMAILYAAGNALIYVYFDRRPRTADGG